MKTNNTPTTFFTEISGHPRREFGHPNNYLHRECLQENNLTTDLNTLLTTETHALTEIPHFLEGRSIQEYTPRNIASPLLITGHLLLLTTVGHGHGLTDDENGEETEVEMTNNSDSLQNYGGSDDIDETNALTTVRHTVHTKKDSQE